MTIAKSIGVTDLPSSRPQVNLRMNCSSPNGRIDERNAIQRSLALRCGSVLETGCRDILDWPLQRRSQRDQADSNDHKNSRPDQESDALARDFESQYRH